MGERRLVRTELWTGTLSVAVLFLLAFPLASEAQGLRLGGGVGQVRPAGGDYESLDRPRTRAYEVRALIDLADFISLGAGGSRWQLHPTVGESQVDIRVRNIYGALQIRPFGKPFSPFLEGRVGPVRERRTISGDGGEVGQLNSTKIAVGGAFGLVANVTDFLAIAAGVSVQRRREGPTSGTFRESSLETTAERWSLRSASGRILLTIP